MNYFKFFPKDTPVLALPNWQNPRLLIPAQIGWYGRWQKSQMYPAYRISAYLYRFLLRAKAVFNVGDIHLSSSVNDKMDSILSEYNLDNLIPVLMIGTPGPAQKLIVQFWHQNGDVFAYLKYAEKPVAMSRLKKEKTVLNSLPSGLAPEVFKYQRFGEGECMLLSPIKGTVLPGKLPPPITVRQFTNKMKTDGVYSIEKHPKIIELVERTKRYGLKLPDNFSKWLDILSKHKWSSVIEHGDFAPWNLITQSDRSLKAIDWEYGNLDGLEGLDVAFYILQTANLIYRWPPEKAARYAEKWITKFINPGLKTAEIITIISISAYNAYLNSFEDGHSDDSSMQVWRRNVWGLI